MNPLLPTAQTLDEVIELFEGAIGDLQLTACGSFVENLNFQAQAVGQARFKRSGVRIAPSRGFSRLGPAWRTLFSLPNIERLGDDFRRARLRVRNSDQCSGDRKSTRLNSSHVSLSRMPSSA